MLQQKRLRLEIYSMDSEMVTTPIVGIIMGSISDAPVMRGAAEVLQEFGVTFEFTVVSAHRTPQLMAEYAGSARSRGLKVIIAGAGGAAHLPGMTAACTTLPVIGVPVKSKNSLDGWDSLLSILQMPTDVPVATVSVDNSRNAGLLAVQMLSLADDTLAARLEEMKARNVAKVLMQREEIKNLF